MPLKKQQVNVCVLGHQRSGKSSTAGHLVYACGGIPKGTREKLEKEAAEEGIPEELKYAWVVEKLREAEGGGVHSNVVKFKSRAREVAVFDNVGRKGFVKNMITGGLQADCAILVVAAPTKEFEDGMAGQTKEHALLAKTLGVKQIVCVVNKMDSTEPPYSHKRFDEVSREVSGCLKKVGYDTKQVVFIPISAFKGDNMIEPSTNMPWYKGWETKTNEGKLSGKTLLDAVDATQPPDREALLKQPLRIPIYHVFQTSGVGTIAQGRVESGSLRPGMSLLFAPSGQNAIVRSVEANHKRVEEALPGHMVSFNIGDVSPDDVKEGAVAGDADNRPPAEAESFVAQVTLLNHPGEISVGYSPLLEVHTARVWCEFAELQCRVDVRSGKVLEENPKGLRSGDTALVKLVPQAPLCVETHKDFPSLGRFVITYLDRATAVGVIKSVKKKSGGKKEDKEPN